jgi:hypothetical protein
MARSNVIVLCTLPDALKGFCANEKQVLMALSIVPILVAVVVGSAMDRLRKSDLCCEELVLHGP